MTQHRECCCDPAPFTTDCLHLDKIFVHEEDEPQWVGEEDDQGGTDYVWDGRAYNASKDFSMWGQVNGSVGEAQPEQYCPDRTYFRTSQWQTIQLNPGGNRKSQKNISGMGCAPCHGSLILSFKRKPFQRESFGFCSLQTGGCTESVEEACGLPAKDCQGGCEPEVGCGSPDCLCRCDPSGNNCECVKSAPSTGATKTLPEIPQTGSYNQFPGIQGCDGAPCSDMLPCPSNDCICDIDLSGNGVCREDGGEGDPPTCLPGQLDDPWFEPPCRGEIIYDQYSQERAAEEEMRALYIAYDDYWYLDLGANGIPYALFDETLGYSTTTGERQAERIRLGPACPQSGYCTLGCPSWASAPGSPFPVDCNWMCNPDLKKTTCTFTPYFNNPDGRTPNEDSFGSFASDAANAGVGDDLGRIQSHLPNIFSSVSSNGRFPRTIGPIGDNPLYPGGFSSYQMYMMQKNPTTRCLADTISFADGSTFYKGLNVFGGFQNCELTELENQYTNLYSSYVGTLHRVRLWVRADQVLLQGGTKYPCTEGEDGTEGDPLEGNPDKVVAFYPPRVNERFFAADPNTGDDDQEPVPGGGYKRCIKEFIAPSMFLYFCSGAPVFYHELEELAEESDNGFTETAKNIIAEAWLNSCSIPGINQCRDCCIIKPGDIFPTCFPCNEELNRCDDSLAQAVTSLGETGKYNVKDWRKDQANNFDTLESGFRQAAETYREDIINDLGEDEAERVIGFLSTFKIPTEFRSRIESKDTELLPVQKSHRYMLPYYISQATRGPDGNPYTLGDDESYKFSGDMSNYQAVAPDNTDVQEPTKFSTLERLDPWLGGQIFGRDRQAPSTWTPMYGRGNRDFEFNYPIQEQWDAWFESGQIDEKVSISPWEDALYKLWYENIPVYFHAVPGGWAWAGDGQNHHFYNPRRVDDAPCNWFNNPSGGSRNLGAGGMNHPYKLQLNGFGSCLYGSWQIDAEPFPNLIWSDPAAADPSQAYVSPWLQPRDAPVVKTCIDVDDRCWGCTSKLVGSCSNASCPTNPDINICCQPESTYTPKLFAGGTPNACIDESCTNPTEELCLSQVNVTWRARNICQTGEKAQIPSVGPGCNYPYQLSSIARNYIGADCGSKPHGAIGNRCVQNYYQSSKGGFRNVKFSSKNNYRLGGPRGCPNMNGYGNPGNGCCAIKYGCPSLAGEEGTELCDLAGLGEEAVAVIHRRENEHVVNVYPYTIRCAQTNEIDGLQRCGVLEKELHINDEEYVDNYLPAILVGMGDPLTCNNIKINPSNPNVESFDSNCGELDEAIIRSCQNNEDDKGLCSEAQTHGITIYTVTADEETDEPLWEFGPHDDKDIINKGAWCMKLARENLFIARSYLNYYTPQGNYNRAVTGIPQYTCPRIGLIRDEEIDRPGRLPASATLTKCAEFYKDKRLADLDTFYQEPPMTTALTFSSLGGYNGTEYAEAFVSTGDIPESHWLRRKVQGLSSIKLFSVGDFNVIGGFSGGIDREDVEPGFGAGSFAGAAAIIFGSTADRYNFDYQEGWKNLKWEFLDNQPEIEQESCTYYMKPSLNPLMCSNSEFIDIEGCMDGAGLTFANKQQGNGDHVGKVYEFMKDPITSEACDIIQPPSGSPVGLAGPIVLDSNDVPFTVNIFDCYYSCITESGCSTKIPFDAC